MPKEGPVYIEKADLLAALAADLRLPLLQIKTKVELLGESNGIPPEHRAELSLSAESGLRLIEAYLYTSHMPGARQLRLEPLSPWHLLEDSAHELSKMAKAYETNVFVDIKACRTPVMADKYAAQLAFVCLGESIIKIQAAGQSEGRRGLLLGGHRAAGGASLGVYGMLEGFSAAILNRARAHAGKTQQPFSSFTPGSAAGLIIADQLYAGFDSPLKTSSHNRLKGLAAFFPLSQQLALI